MKKIIKKGVCITLIYAVAVLCTFIMANRIEKLNENYVSTAVMISDK